MKKLLLLFLLLPQFINAQNQGKVIDDITGQGIFNAKIKLPSGEVIVTNEKGVFDYSELEYPAKLIVRATTYIGDTIEISSQKRKLVIRLIPEGLSLKTVVVSAGKTEEYIEEVPISMEVISTELIDNKGLVNLEQAVDQSPGVYAMDGQVSIRGGGGYAYGAGSRVLVLVDGIPMVSPDLGDAKWNAIPLEAVDQIEVIKGASSVLYGSGALNGIIAMKSKEPSMDGDLSVKYQSGVYDNPRRQSLIWWDKNPWSHLLQANYGKSFTKMGYTIGVNGYTTDGYKAGETEDRVRLSGSFFMKPENVKNLKFGINYSAQLQQSGNFILWESDSLGYTPLGGADPDVSGSSLTIEKNMRLNIDPYVKYFDKNGNRHELKYRHYLVSIGSPSNLFNSSRAHMNFADYQFATKLNDKHDFTSGVTGSYNSVISSVFGGHQSLNLAGYSQATFHWGKFDWTAGVRFEYFRQDDRSPDSEWTIKETTIPVFPVLRTAVHYEATKLTHLRASFGQGIRFPSVAERFTSTSNGGVVIFPNPDLVPEMGWAGEIGVKQIFKISEWKASVDIAGFVNQYSEMVEFAFGYYKPDSIASSANPDDIGYYLNWLGFRATNSEDARIMGVELSINSQGHIGKVELTTLLGYTYMNPITLNTDSTYLLTFSNDSTRMLKYRFKHLAKADIQAKYKSVFLGVSSRYNSFMSNIDVLFEDGIAGEEVLPGLKEYRLANQGGSLVFDARLGYVYKERYRIGLMVNNLLNAEYSSRQGDIQPPRQFLLQLNYKL